MMKGTTTIYRADGNTETKTWDEDNPGLKFLQEAVGGYIELVPYFNRIANKDCDVYCDEEGKLKKKPLNSAATMLWEEALGRKLQDVLVGDVVAVSGDKEFMKRHREGEDE